MDQALVARACGPDPYRRRVSPPHGWRRTAVMRVADSRAGALRRAADRFLCRRGAAAMPAGGTLWAAEFFGLDRVRPFREAHRECQAAALVDCGAGLIAESWFIECCGVRFCAR